jgi:hypothetical protein
VRRWALLRLLLVIGAVGGCAGGERHWTNLPPARDAVSVHRPPEDAAVDRAARIVARLAAARPLPVDVIVIASSGYLTSRFGAGRFRDDNAGTFRCGDGEPPPSGCIYVGDRLLAALSDDALAGVLAHELGHLERGHRPAARPTTAAACERPAYSIGEAWTRLVQGCTVPPDRGTAWQAVGAYRSREIEREADDAAIARLAAAGYCAGPVMRATFTELSGLKPGPGSGGVLASHPGYAERWERAGSGCAEDPKP